MFKQFPSSLPPFGPNPLSALRQPAKAHAPDAADLGLVKFSPPTGRPHNMESETSSFRGVRNNVPREWVFEGSVSVRLADLGMNIPANLRRHTRDKFQMLMFDVTAENGFQSRAIVPVTGYSDKEMAALRKNLAKPSRKPIILYQNERSWLAVLERPIEIAENRVIKPLFEEITSEATDTKMQYKDGSLIIRSFVSRVRPNGEFVAEPEILSGYPALTAYERSSYGSGNPSRGRPFLYLSPDVVRDFGKQGTLFNLPYIRFNDPHLSKLGFSSETIEMLGENGKPVQTQFNCYTNFKGIMVPLRKPSEQNFDDPLLQPIRALLSVPRALWRDFTDRLILNQYIDSIESIDATALADVQGEARRHASSGQHSERPVLGAVYDGPRDSIAFYRDQFVVFALTLANDTKVYLVDSPRYGTALHVYTSSEMAKLHTQGSEARKISTNDPSHLRRFVHDPEGRWREQLQEFLLSMQGE